MKLKDLITVVCCLFISVTLYSQDGKDEISVTKEISYMEPTGKYRLKAVYMYDSSKKCTARYLYIENSYNSWLPAYKYEYKYNSKNLIKNIIFTKWDKDKDNWSKTTLSLVHFYDSSGRFLSQKERINDNNLISAK